MDDIIREKNAQFVDIEKEINYLKQTLSEQSKEKELLTKIYNVFKNESKEKKAKNIDKEIALEKKVKELDNIVCKIETLMLEEESQSKMLLKQSDPKVLGKKVNIKPINYAELNRLSKDFEGEWRFSRKQTYKQIYDSIKPSCVQPKEHVESLVNKLNQKSVEITDLNTQLQEKDKNNRETHIYYLKHMMEQATLLKEIVEQAKLLNPLDSASYFACKYVKLIQELLGYVRDTFPDIHKPSEKLVVVTPINKKKTDRITTTNKVPLREPIHLEVVAQESVVTKVYTRIPKVPKTNGSNSKPKIVKSMISNKMEPGTSRGSNTSVSPSSSSIDLRLSKLFCGIWIPDAPRYGDYQIGNIKISRVYYVEGLGHNLFSVGQFCDFDLEVAFRKRTCFVYNLKVMIYSQDLEKPTFILVNGGYDGIFSIFSLVQSLKDQMLVMALTIITFSLWCY
nr:integrase, catalytic region, zinc finger, CCHC-type, peptidase aspartic, catalytic [Tanacetum cinerariifolium]